MGTPYDRHIREVVKAIRVEGPGPKLHQDIMARHREEWPTLWRALDHLVAAYDRSEDTVID